MAENNGGSSTLLILLKLILFTLVVPATVTVWVPLFALFPAIRHRLIEWNMASAAAIALIAIGVALCFHLLVLIHEEPNLRRRMGAAYEGYCKQVPRWIPRFASHRQNHAL
jgi:protein-S-isoprenylcysteine O-methyltransferase Ste14